MAERELSIVIPAKNEEPALSILLPEIKSLYPDAEIIVIDDGSTDGTREVCQQNGVIVASNPYSMGNGAAIKKGARLATGKTLVFMDGDGQHNPKEIATLLDGLDTYDMVIGARNYGGQANLQRAFANTIYSRMASFMTGHDIRDLTSGFRAVDAKKFKRFLYLLPNGFSYPTTITMAFFRSAYTVHYVPISVKSRTGKSKINPVKDGLRFLLIILKIGALFSPMRLFLPISFFSFLIGLSYYAYTYIQYTRFTNMSALLFITAILVFLIGIVSEQISSLHYKGSEQAGADQDS